MGFFLVFIFIEDRTSKTLLPVCNTALGPLGFDFTYYSDFDIKAFYLPLNFSLVLIYVLLFFTPPAPVDCNWLNVLQVAKSF